MMLSVTFFISSTCDHRPFFDCNSDAAKVAVFVEFMASRKVSDGVKMAV